MYKGQLEGFPKEVVEKMIERQVEQGNPRDVSVFEKRRTIDKGHLGFTWVTTDEGGDFWDSVIEYKDFDLFFKRYPKSETLEQERDRLEEINEQLKK